MNLERIGKYEILGEIGRGTMGTVYKAKDPVLNRFVAIKTMAATPGRNDESKKRFRQEAQAVALLSHPNIVTMHDLGEEQGLIYMAMELLEGHDLREAISEGKVATIGDKVQVMEQVAAGLAFAHSKGVVHRDLKPANIHIQPNGQVKIVDFGLARVPGSDMTHADVVLGTPNYMSPEQALGDKVDARTDVFSAGGVFYELLTGRKPFDAETTPGVLYQVVHKEALPIRKWAPEAPSLLVEVVDRCLTKDKNLRFPNGRQLRAALGLVRQALDGGRADATTLAEESQRAHEEARKNDSSQRGVSPAASRAPWVVNGNVALEPTPLTEPQAPLPSRATSPTLSGRAPTQPAARRSVPRRASVPWLPVGALVLAGGALLYWYETRPRGPVVPPPPAAKDASREVSALTEALVESQIELAIKDLEDKNWAGAISSAERALKLQPESARARKVLEQARGRLGELEAAASEARRAFEAGNLPEAARALGRVLELDPRHPAVGELTARLNTTFKSRAQDAQRLAVRARGEAERARAASLEGFAEAVDRAVEGDALFQKAEFAEAAQRYLDARDSFDRLRRLAQAPSRPATLPAQVAADQGAAAAPAPGPLFPPPPPNPPPARDGDDDAPLPTPARQFVVGPSVLGSARSAGDLAGFDSADVKTKQIPDLAGQLEFEVDPPAPARGEGITVRVYFVSASKKAVRVRNVAVTAIVDGETRSLSASLRERDIASQQRALVAEAASTWPEAPKSWSVQAVLTSERDETCTSRLTWQ